MIYVDSSIMLAYLFAEDRRPTESFWELQLVASRLLDYEVWVALHRWGHGGGRREQAERLLTHVSMAPLLDPVIARARDPFPVDLRALDAIHMATALYLSTRAPITIATYDQRFANAATALDLPLESL